MPLSDEQHAWLVKTLGINVKHAAVETDTGNEMGFKPRARGAEYEGEEKKLGAWRAGEKQPGQTDEEHEAWVNEGFQVTRQYSDAEREANTLKADESGTLRSRDGSTPTGSSKLYAVDPKTGDMVLGDGTSYTKRALDADGNPAGELPKGASFKGDQRDAMYSHGTERVEMMHHSTPLRGGDVAAAGFVDIQDGKVTKITNASGHYKPQFEHLLQAVEHMMKTGAMLDTEIVDQEGRSLEDTDPKAFAVYTKTRNLIRSLDADKASLKAAKAGLHEGALEEHEVSEIEKKIATHRARTETAQKALAALRKMGIGPRNAMSGDVELTYAEGDVSGNAFRTEAKTEKMPAHDFLMGKGAGRPVPAGDDLDEDDIPFPSSEGGSYVTELYSDHNAGGSGSSGPDKQYDTALDAQRQDEDGEGDEASDPEGRVNPISSYNRVTDADMLDGPEGGSDDGAIDAYKTVLQPDTGSAEPDPGGPAKPWRDFDAKEDMLEEFRQHVKDKGLRPEDQGAEGAKQIFEGQAPQVDEAEWRREIDEIADALSDIEAEMKPPAREDQAGAQSGGNAASVPSYDAPPLSQEAQDGGYGNVPSGDGAPEDGYGNAPAAKAQPEDGYGDIPGGKSRPEDGYGNAPVEKARPEDGYGNAPPPRKSPDG